MLHLCIHSQAHDRAGKEEGLVASQLHSLTAFVTSQGSHNICQLSTKQAAETCKAEGREHGTSKA